MELLDFVLKANKGWLAINSKKSLREYGFKTQRLGKYVEDSQMFQVTIGSTDLGQEIGLNSEIGTLILAFFPFSPIQYIQTTNGNSDKPSYPSFKFECGDGELNDFLKKLENLIIARCKEFA